MATAQLSTFTHQTNPAAAGSGDGICIGSAMIGAASGALAGTTLVAGSFEYAAVLIGTLGVVLGSVVAGTAGRYLIAPTWKAFCNNRQG